MQSGERERKKQLFMLDMLTWKRLDDIHMNLQIDPGERLGHFCVDLEVCLKNMERCEPQI